MLRYRTNMEINVPGSVLAGGHGICDSIYCKLSILTDASLSGYQKEAAAREAVRHLKETGCKYTVDQLAVSLQKVRPNWDIELISRDASIDMYSDPAMC